MIGIQVSDPYSRNQLLKYQELDRNVQHFRWFELLNIGLITLQFILLIFGLYSISNFRIIYAYCIAPDSPERKDACRMYNFTITDESSMETAVTIAVVVLLFSVIFNVALGALGIQAYRRKSYPLINCLFVTYIVVEMVALVALNVFGLIIFGVLIFGAFRLKTLLREIETVTLDLRLQGIEVETAMRTNHQAAPTGFN